MWDLQERLARKAHPDSPAPKASPGSRVGLAGWVRLERRGRGGWTAFPAYLALTVLRVDQVCRDLRDLKATQAPLFQASR